MERGPSVVGRIGGSQSGNIAAAAFSLCAGGAIWRLRSFGHLKGGSIALALIPTLAVAELLATRAERPRVCRILRCVNYSTILSLGAFELFQGAIEFKRAIDNGETIRALLQGGRSLFGANICLVPITLITCCPLPSDKKARGGLRGGRERPVVGEGRGAGLRKDHGRDPIPLWLEGDAGISVAGGVGRNPLSSGGRPIAPPMRVGEPPRRRGQQTLDPVLPLNKPPKRVIAPAAPLPRGGQHNAPPPVRGGDQPRRIGPITPGPVKVPPPKPPERAIAPAALAGFVWTSRERDPYEVRDDADDLLPPLNFEEPSKIMAKSREEAKKQVVELGAIATEGYKLLDSLYVLGLELESGRAGNQSESDDRAIAIARWNSVTDEIDRFKRANPTADGQMAEGGTRDLYFRRFNNYCLKIMNSEERGTVGWEIARLKRMDQPLVAEGTGYDGEEIDTDDDEPFQDPLILAVTDRVLPAEYKLLTEALSLKPWDNADCGESWARQLKRHLCFIKLKDEAALDKFFKTAEARVRQEEREDPTAFKARQRQKRMNCLKATYTAQLQRVRDRKKKRGGKG